MALGDSGMAGGGIYGIGAGCGVGMVTITGGASCSWKVSIVVGPISTLADVGSSFFPPRFLGASTAMALLCSGVNFSLRALPPLLPRLLCSVIRLFPLLILPQVEQFVT